MGKPRMDYVPGSYAYPIGAKEVNLRDKNAMIDYYVRRWLAESQTMLEFDGLPETMPARDITRLIQTHGFMVLIDPAKTGGKLYAFRAGLGGEPDPYYMPTIATVANPALNLSIEGKIHDDAVVIPHDSYYMGLLPIFNHYATLVVEADLSIYLSAILSRAPVHIGAQGDRCQASAMDYLKDLEAGKLGAIFEDGFLDGLKSVPGSAGQSNQSITNLIELRQYLKASRYNSIGLNANYNMKRESINAAEAQMDDDALMPYIQNVIRTIQNGLDEANAKGWCDIHVRLGGIWANRERIEDAHVEEVENAAQAGSTEPKKTEEPEVKKDETAESV